MKDPREGKLSMSGLKANALCPGRHNAEKECPEPPPSPDADMGTRSHTAVETGDTSNLSDDEKKGVEIAKERETEALLTWLDDIESDSGLDKCEIIREKRLKGLGVSGQADLIAIKEPYALILDFKFGRGEHDLAPENLQLRGYAVLLLENYPDLEAITVGIIQPWVTPQLSIAYYDLDDLTKARGEVESIIHLSQDPEAPRIPSVEACKYCKAAATCQEYQTIGLAVANIDPNDLIPIESMPMLLDLCDMAEKAIDARAKLIRNQAKEFLAQNPMGIENWTLAPGRKIRKVDDPGAAFETLAAAGLIDARGMLKSTKLSLPTLEKQVAQYTESPLREAKDQVAQFLGGQIEIGETAPTLKRK